MSHNGDPDDVALSDTTGVTTPTAASGAPASLAPGMVLNETYRLDQLLGRGGMGEVWKAAHLRLPKAVAIKVLLPTTTPNKELEQRFKREAEIGSILAHPHIVHVFDFNELPDGRKYIVMDFLEGESLGDRLERGPFDLAEASHVLAQCALGLRVAHDAGVVHRDLKPDNVFLATEAGADPPYRVKLLDFGISKIQAAETALTRDMAVMGTPGYMAPEQALGDTAKLGPRADQFALGTMAYEMLAGRSAFDGQTLAEIIYKVVQETPPPLTTLVPGLPPRCGDAIARAMAKDPGERFADVTSFVDAFLGRRPVTDAEPNAATVAAAATAAATPLPPRDSGAGRGPAPPTSPADAAPAEPADARPARRGWPGPLGIGLGLLALGAMAFVGVLLLRGPGAASVPADDAEQYPDQGTATGTEATMGQAPDPPGNTGAAGTPEDQGPSNEQTPADAAAASDGTAEGSEDDGSGADHATEPDERAKTGRRSGDRDRPRTRGVTPDDAEAKRLLTEAERALDAGQSGQAIVLARRSLRAERSAGARAVLAKAYCQQRNLSQANVMNRGLPSRMRREVRRYCAGYDLTLR